MLGITQEMIRHGLRRSERTKVPRLNLWSMNEHVEYDYSLLLGPAVKVVHRVEKITSVKQRRKGAKGPRRSKLYGDV